MTMTIERPHRDPAEAFGPSPRAEELATLYARLVAQAEDEGLLDVAYRTLDTPVGTLLLAATPTGLVRVAYEREGLDAVLRKPGGPRSAPESSAPHGGSTRPPASSRTTSPGASPPSTWSST